MAVHAALTSLTQILENLMHNDHHQQYNFPMPLILNDDEGQQIIKSLHESLCFLQSFLENYHHEPKIVRSSLEGRIRDAAYKAEDLIESHIANHICSEYEWFGLKKGFRKSIEAVQKILLPRKQAERLMEMHENFRRVMGEIDLIVEESKKIVEIDEHFRRMIEGIELVVEETKKIVRSSTNFIDEEEDLQPPVMSSDGSFGASASSSRPTPIPDTCKMVGFDKDLLKIKDWLCGESSSRRQTISIVGMGGIGKTTLARNIFDDSLVAYHFHTRAWMTISQQYCLRDTLLKLLDSVIGSKTDLMGLGDEEMKEYVYKSLKGRKYLVIMDDMWGTNVWDDLGRILPDDYNGSRILLTTRLLDVATYTGSSSAHLHSMQFLNEDQSWNLLRDKVFAEERCPIELDVIGKKIATRCGGLPLGIVLVAGLLSKVPSNPHDWESFAENVSSTLAADDENFLKIMSLSYNNLPHHLKPCFLYIGGFPEDYEIPVFKLLQLWIAEGFLRSIGSKSLEEVAKEYLEDLARRNLVLITKKSSIGKFRFCRIHDLLRDFCIQKSKYEDFFLHIPWNFFLQQEETRNVRRLFLFRWGISEVLRNATSSHVRTVIFSSPFFNETVQLPSPTTMPNLLRVFDGLETELHLFPTEITKLFLLRYLSFGHKFFRKYVVPESISRLRNLQTIIIQSRSSFYLVFLQDQEPSNIYLPDEIWRMPQLRHLILHNSCHLPNPPIDDEKCPILLPNLQTLSRIVNFIFEEKCIEMIPNLKKLRVNYTKWNPSTEWSKYSLHNFLHLHQIESLDLTINSISGDEIINEFPMNFVLPPKLRKLALGGCFFTWEKMSVIGSLPNLEVLKLRVFAFCGKEWVTVEGEFPRLKFLLMDEIPLKRWRAENSHFPRLERLIIRNCEKLVEIPCGIGDIQTLQFIEVDSKSKSAADSAIRIQDEQHDLGNDSLQVRIIHE